MFLINTYNFALKIYKYAFLISDECKCYFNLNKKILCLLKFTLWCCGLALTSAVKLASCNSEIYSRSCSIALVTSSFGPLTLTLKIIKILKINN